MPDLLIETSCQGRVAGVDEAGRGPLAGPVVAAAVHFTSPVPGDLAALIDDSKRLEPEAREAAYAALRASGVAEISLGAASVDEIGRLNILHASLLAMSRAIARLPHRPDIVLVDGNRAPPGLHCAARCVIGGDGISLSIAAASIAAKVVRDRLMGRLDRRFPGYDWGSNAGYATPSHRAALRRLGPTAHHRTAFGTVRQLALAAFAPAE